MKPASHSDSAIASSLSTSSGLADRLSISKKLFAMLVLPIVGLLVFASFQIAEKYTVMRNMSQLEGFTKLAIEASQLVHELQRERGRSANFLTSQDRDSADLQAQRARTDEEVATFREALTSLPLDGELRRVAEAAARATQDLTSHRTVVSSRGIAVIDSNQFYGGAITALLSLVSNVVENASSASITLSLTSLDALLKMKELAGQERALASAIMLNPAAAPVDARELTRRIGMQDGYADAFLAHASDRAVQEFRTITAAAYSEEVMRLREKPFALLVQKGGAAAVVTTIGNGSSSATTGAAATDGTDSEAWWRAASARIDGLFGVEQVIESELLDEVTGLRSQASWALVMYSTLALACVIAAIAISYVLARSMIQSFTQASTLLTSIVSQIAGFVRQQASATSETATAVSQTTTTVEELSRTAQTASSRSREMTGMAQQSKSASEQALAAVSHGVEAMQQIRAEVEGIAENILELSEKNMQIGEIVQSVNAIAEQSNLLAVNASIEAAKAGEHGKGFSVVAAEVKALAQQSKQATDQIRTILAEIQKSSNGAVMITEQGVKRVEEGSSLVEELGQTIRSLGGTIEESSDSANQISLISTQQLAGIEQITDAMRNIGAATSQNAEGARQLEQAADQIRMVSTRILEIVQGQKVHAGPVLMRAAE